MGQPEQVVGARGEAPFLMLKLEDRGVKPKPRPAASDTQRQGCESYLN